MSKRSRGSIASPNRNSTSSMMKTFLKLRRSQACQSPIFSSLSMRNIDTLGKLAMAQIGVAQKQASRASELFPGDRDGDLKFDWSKLLSKD
jgi:hypothetical protein